MRQLTQNEQKVVDYIREHAGCSKADVVRHMSELASRITVRNYIDTLEAEKIINCKMDKPNF
jgi:Penicillinase repressor